MTVICAGAKAILDLPLTLEYLETFGVPVLGYKSSNLAAFYSKDSGFKLDYEMKDEKEIAQVIKCKRQLKLDGGILVSNPILDQDSIDNEYINNIINNAIDKANNLQIKGKDITPFLLKEIVDETQNKSLMANIALIYNNALVGSKIAFEYNQIKNNND